MVDMRVYTEPRLEIVEKDVEAFAEVLNRLADNGKLSRGTADLNIHYFTQVMQGTASLDDCWDIMAYGAYKECYALDQNWVIKFASEYNRTPDEMALLNKAIDENLGDLFVETYFIPLEGFHPILYNLESDNWTFDESANTYVERDPDFEVNERASFCVIQRRIETTVSETHTRWIDDIADQYFAEERDVNEIFDGFPFLIASKIPITSFDWLDTSIKLYGSETMTRFANFCDEEGIHDLHIENIGYRLVDGKRIPVIIDWLSSTR